MSGGHGGQAATNGGGGVAVGRTGSRSSRRILSPAPVELGGGAGVLGRANSEAYYAALRRVPSSSTTASPYPSPAGSLVLAPATTATAFDPRSLSAAAAAAAAPVLDTSSPTTPSTTPPTTAAPVSRGFPPPPRLRQPARSSEDASAAASHPSSTRSANGHRPSPSSPRPSASGQHPPPSVPSRRPTHSRSESASSSRSSRSSSNSRSSPNGPPSSPPPTALRHPHPPHPHPHHPPHDHSARGPLAAQSTIPPPSGDPGQPSPMDRMRSGNPAPPPAPPSFAQGPLPQTPAATHPAMTTTTAAPASPQGQSPFMLGASTPGGLKARSKKAPAPIRTGRSDRPAGHEHHQPPPPVNHRSGGDVLDLTDTPPTIRMTTPQSRSQAKLGHGRPDRAQPAPPMVPLKDASDLHRTHRAATDPVNGQQPRRPASPPSSAAGRKSGRFITPNPAELVTRGVSDNSGRRTPTAFGGSGTANSEREREQRAVGGTLHGSPSSTGRKNVKTAATQHTINPNHRPAPPPPVPVKSRPSMDASLPPAEIINLNKMERDREQQGGLMWSRSVGTGQPADPASQRTPVLSLKKSSGALRNLFRSKKDVAASSPSDSTGSRPSVSDIIRPSQFHASSSSSSYKTNHSPQSSFSNTASSKGSIASALRKSSDLNRVAEAATSSAATTAGNERFFTPPSQLYPATSQNNSPTPSSLSAPPRAASRHPPHTRSGPSSTKDPRSLPDGPRETPSLGRGGQRQPHETPAPPAKARPQNTVSPAMSDSSTSTVRALSGSSAPAAQGDSVFETASESRSDDTESTASWSPISRPTEALSLLQLPELDLAFDFSAFDAIGLSSPTTPRNRSPAPPPVNGSGSEKSGVASATASKAATPPTRASSVKKMKRTDSDRDRRAERRRSKSVDARGLTDVNQSWMPPHVSKLYMASANSASVLAPTTASPMDDWFSSPPTLLVPPPSGSGPSVPSANATHPPPQAPLDVPTSVSSSVRSVNTPRATSESPAPAEYDNGSTHSLAQSSTLSGSSSTQETHSTSSPHTPEDAYPGILTAASVRPQPDPGLKAAPTLASALGPPIALATPVEIDAGLNGNAKTKDAREGSTKLPTPPPKAATREARTPVGADTKQRPKTPERKPSKGLSPALAATSLTLTANSTSTSTSTSATAVAVAPTVAAAAAAMTAAVTSTALTPPAITTTAPDASKTAPVEEPNEPEQIPPSKAPFRARLVNRILTHKATPIIPDPSISLRDLTRELERSLDKFRYPMQQGGGPERSLIIRNELLLFCSELDKRCYSRKEEAQYYDLREVCFEWGDALLYELRVEQPANERGACLEGLAAILECSALTSDALQASRSHHDAFTQLMMRVMTFVMDKLGAKGVFHNTLLFSGRFLAFAFFRIPHVGGQLVGVLQPPRGALMRFTRPHLIGKTIPEEAQSKYPAHLASLCFDDAQSYTRRLQTLDPVFATAEEKDAFHFQPGNWLRRWQSDDSELFPAFYRAYHCQLASYLGPAVEYYQTKNQQVPPHVLLRAPAYAHLATIFATKCHSYILGSVNAVTTSSSNNNFDLNESAGFRGSQKPPVLETANRRLVEVLWTFASSILSIPSSGHMIEVEGSQLWGDMIDIWMKNLITKTSLYQPKGVFCLFDMLDGIVDPVQPTSSESPLDIPYLIGLVRTILTEGEHALTIVKVIAFVFTHWEILTVRPADRRELCLDILLNKPLFERLLLFWSQSVRSYVLRLVVFRLGHLHTTKEDAESHEVEIESVRLLQTRLDAIKKRHDELEPGAATEEMEAETTPRTPTAVYLPRSKSTITMVTDSPQPASKAEKLLGFGMASGSPDDDKDKASNTKASWWKRTLSATQIGKSKGGKSWKRGGATSSDSPTSTTPPTASSSTVPSTTSNHLTLPPSTTHLAPSAVTTHIRLGPNTAHLAPSLMPADPPSPSSSGSSSSDLSPTTRRKAPPPSISTSKDQPELVPGGSKPEGRAFQFEFELPTASPRSDAFDPVASPSSPQSRRHSQPPSPHSQTSPHMSAQFSKRSSLLPSSTANALDLMQFKATLPVPRDPGYPRRLHAYAIRMLAELEDAQKEYDEWWSEWGIGKVDGAPPRLAVAWPFHEGDD